jgi:hypothetical protein
MYRVRLELAWRRWRGGGRTPWPMGLVPALHGWTPVARLQAVIATAAKATRSAWCREQGLYAAELEAWKQDAIAGLGEPRAASAAEARQGSAPGERAGTRTTPQGQGTGRNAALARVPRCSLRRRCGARHPRAAGRSVRGSGWLCSSHLLRCAPWLGRCQVAAGKQLESWICDVVAWISVSRARD